MDAWERPLVPTDPHERKHKRKSDQSNNSDNTSHLETALPRVSVAYSQTTRTPSPYGSST